MELLIEQISQLPLHEQEALWEVYDKIVGQSGWSEYAQLADAEYVRRPARIAEFLSDPYFLGESSGSLWPKLKDDMVELFEGDYYEGALGGSIGWGKSVSGCSTYVDQRSGFRRLVSEQSANAAIASLFGCQVGTKAVDRIWKSGRKQCARMTLASGQWIEVSLDHRIRTPGGWDELAGLVPGALVAAARRVPAPAGAVARTDSEVLLTAALIADGSGLGHKQVVYVKGDRRLVDAVIDAARLVPGFGGVGRDVFDRGAHHVSLLGLGSFVVDMGIDCNSTKKRVPASFFGLPDHQLALFLRWLYTDGSVYTGNPRKIEIALSSEGLVDDVQALLRRFGIVARKSYQPKSAQKGEEKFDSWRLQIADAPNQILFLERIGVVPGKEDACAKLREQVYGVDSNPNWDVVPITIVELKEIRHEIGGMPNKEWLGLAALEDGSYMGSQRFCRLCEVTGYRGRFYQYAQMANDIVWERVKTIESTGIQDVYEISVPGTRNMVINGGPIVHNSFFATCAMAYTIYQMSCLRSPQKAYGIDAGSHIYVAMLSVTEKVAKRVTVNELIGKIQHSRYFKEHFPIKAAASQLEIRFPNNVQVVAGSTGSSAVIGLNVFSAFIDEVSFMGSAKETGRGGKFVSVDTGEKIYQSIVRRMKSRFQRAGRVPGVLLTVSSKERPGAFIEKRIREAREQNDRHFFVREYCLAGDTRIPLLNGEEPTIRELAERYDGLDDRFWVYSFDVKSRLIVPGLAHHPRLTLRDVEVFAVTLDSGDVMRVTWNHPFMLRSGEYRRASELVPGDALMPLYRRLSEKGYEEVGQPLWDGRWQKMAREGCTPGCVAMVLRRAGMPAYTKLGMAPHNHRVVSVVPCGKEDVFDLSVDEYENFAVSAGVFVHNSTWDVRPAEFFSPGRFKVVAGNDKVQSRILTDDPREEERYREMGLQIVEIPDDYRLDFERDIDGGLRDIAGIATEAVSPFMQRVDTISAAMCSDLPLGVRDDSGKVIEEWVANTPLPIQWPQIAQQYERKLTGGFVEVAWRPIRHPNAIRYARIDTSLTGDATGIAIAHIANWTEVIRRDYAGEEYTELAPVIETDLLLRVIPPPGDEILLSDMRAVLYQFIEHGFQIGYVTCDQFQSADTLQQLRKRGIDAELLSVDRTTEPYDVTKAAFYEGRMRLQRHVYLGAELRNLQRVPTSGGRVKIDHPKLMVGPNGNMIKGSKDLADALSGTVYSITQRSPGQPIAPMLGKSETGSEKKDDPSWVTGGAVVVEGTSQVHTGEGKVGGGKPLPFVKG